MAGLCTNLCILCLKLVIILVFIAALGLLLVLLREIQIERGGIQMRYSETRWTYVEQCSNSKEVYKNLVLADVCASHMAYITLVDRSGSWNLAFSNYMERMRFCGGAGCAAYLQDSVRWLGALFVVAMILTFAVIWALYKLVDSLNERSHRAYLQSRSDLIGGTDYAQARVPPLRITREKSE